MRHSPLSSIFIVLKQCWTTRMTNTDIPCCPQVVLLQASTCAWNVLLKTQWGKDCAMLIDQWLSVQYKSSASSVFIGLLGDTGEHKTSWKVWALTNFARTLENVCIDSAQQDRKMLTEMLLQHTGTIWAREDAEGWGHGFCEAGGKPLLGELAPKGWRWMNLPRGRQTPLNARKKNVMTCSPGILITCSSPTTLLSRIMPTLA